MDLCTGPLARASRLSADALTCGWPDGQPCGLPTRPTTGRRLHTSSTGLHHDRPNRARQECKGPVRRSGLASRHDSTSGAASPLQYDIVPTIFPAQHSIGSESVTLPKSPVTFAEIRKGLGHADRQAGLRGYCTGLMAPLKRKSVEPMAAHLAPSATRSRHQSLHHFVADSAWSDEQMLLRVAQWVVPAMDFRRRRLVDR